MIFFFFFFYFFLFKCVTVLVCMSTHILKSHLEQKYSKRSIVLLRPQNCTVSSNKITRALETRMSSVCFQNKLNMNYGFGFQLASFQPQCHLSSFHLSLSLSLFHHSVIICLFLYRCYSVSVSISLSLAPSLSTYLRSSITNNTARNNLFVHHRQTV